MKNPLPDHEPDTVLVALMNNPADFRLLKEKGWYRIPVGRHAPRIVRDGSVQQIAFYQTKAFKNDPFTIRWYGEVSNIREVTRLELFPDTPSNHKKINRRYYQLFVRNLRPLEKPIRSHRPRRLLFIPTSAKKFYGAMLQPQPEINQLFNESPLEDLLFNRLIKERIYPERQYVVENGSKKWRLDFAVFCKTTNLDIETDGMQYHYSTTAQKLYDNTRNNDLHSKEWKALRFPTHEITDEMDTVISKIKTAIDNHGGLQSLSDPKFFTYTIRSKQGRLF